jgi:dihydrofolate reductase
VGKLVVSEFVTLDGVFEDPGGAEGFDRGGWAFKFERGAAGDKFKLDETLAAEVLLLGRKTYEGFAAAWPDRTDEAGFADKMNSMQKVVVSTTLEHAEWANTTIVRDDVVAAVNALREQPGGDVLVAGSGTLVQTLLREDLVDELRLLVYPVLLGAGRRLFEDGSGQAALELVDTLETGDVVILTFRPARDGQ